MSIRLQGFRAGAKLQAEELLHAIASAEAIIVSTIERECEALRTGRMLAAEALHLRLCDAARLYLSTTKAARASLATIEHVLPGASRTFEMRRAAFANVLKVELAVLATERAAVEQAWGGPASHPAAKPNASSRRRTNGPALQVVTKAETRPAASRQNAPLSGRR